MKRFQFPLERVREWRGTQVDLEYAKLQKLFEQMRRLERTVAALETEVRSAEGELQAVAAARRPMTGRQLARLDDFRLYAKRQQQLLAARQDELRGRIAEQRGRLVEARRNFRLLERLKQQALEEWERDYYREMENLASELHLARWKPAGTVRP